MLDFQVECRAKTLRTRGSTSKTMQIPQKCTVLSPNCCKGHITQGIPVFLNALIFFIPRGIYFFLIPHPRYIVAVSIISIIRLTLRCIAPNVSHRHTRAHIHHTHTPTHTLVICSFTTPSASSPYLSS